MNIIKKLFGEVNITYKFLIIFSIILGISVGILNRIPFLLNTSFQDIAIWIDMWIILAIFIIINCDNCFDAMIKCFLFFLISQPLIYLTEGIIDIIVLDKTFDETIVLYFKNYYLGAGWLFRTFLTIPGSFIAYYVKKNNILSSLILSVAVGYLSFVGTRGLLNTAIYNFPYHLLNSLICLVMSFVLIFVILKNRRERIISLFIVIICIIVSCILFFWSSNNPIIASEVIEFDSDIVIVDAVVMDENIALASICDDGSCVYVYSSSSVGSTDLVIKDSSGNIYNYIVNSSSRDFEIDDNN